MCYISVNKMAIDIAAWYEKYGPMVIRRCRRILSHEEALDAVQDVFVNLLSNAGKLDNRYPSSLLYTMATNVCLNRLRKKKREHPVFDESLLFFTDEGFDQVEAQIMLEDILKDESELNRAICFMYHADGMTLKEIGEAVELSISGVRKRLEGFKTRARLKVQKGEAGK